jgi:glycosyltransferase involved in cell wall biosynthesis
MRSGRKWKNSPPDAADELIPFGFAACAIRSLPDKMAGLQMNVLISAIACAPHSGSEPYFGWSAVNALARDHKLCVMTCPRQRPELEQAAAEGLVPANVRFVYAGHFDEYHPNRMMARFQSWKEYIHFSKEILPLAKQLHETERFDLVHHITYATWRVASPLWQLGIPFVFGPIGGNEQFPLRLFPILSPAAAAFEVARMASNVASRFSPGVRACIRRAAHVFVANAETEQLVKSMRVSGDGVSRLMATFHSEEKVRAFTRFATDKKMDGPLRLFAAGNMEGRKGVALALQSLARAKKAGVNFVYRLGANGPEIPHLKRLAAKLDLSREVLFADNLHGEDYQRELGATHIYLLPSLRDSAPVTLTEAMLAGCVPVVADGGGPGIMVAEGCGYKIPANSSGQMVDQITETLLAIDRDRTIIPIKGGCAAKRIATHFTEENYRRTVNQVYQNLINPGAR